MPVIAGLIRGINVGGHHKIQMQTLRELCAGIGMSDPQTLLQSGNVVFAAPARGLARLAGKLEDAIEEAMGFRPAVILRTTDELEAIVERSPLAAREGLDPAKVAVLFLRDKPEAAAIARMRTLKCGSDEAHVAAQELYLYFPNGFGRPTLAVAAVERALGTVGTARNWNTVTKLLAMCRSRR